MEIRIPVVKKIERATPLPERVGTIIVDNESERVYLLAVNPDDQDTPYLMSLAGDSYYSIARNYSEPCEMLTYGDIECTLGSDFTLYTTEEYMLDLVAKKRQKRS